MTEQEREEFRRELSKQRYSVSAISSSGPREYKTDDLARADKKANAWISHGWGRVTIFDHTAGRFVRK